MWRACGERVNDKEKIWKPRAGEVWLRFHPYLNPVFWQYYWDPEHREEEAQSRFQRVVSWNWPELEARVGDALYPQPHERRRDSGIRLNCEGVGGWLLQRASSQWRCDSGSLSGASPLFSAPTAPSGISVEGVPWDCHINITSSAKLLPNPTVCPFH